MRASLSAGLSKLQLPQLREKKARADTSSSHKETAWTNAIAQTIQSRLDSVSGDLNRLTESVMLATAEGASLDQAVALLGVQRQIITPADEKENPPIPAVMESDDRLRSRARYSVQALNHSGCEGSYRFFAMSASADVKDVSVFSRDWLEGSQNVSIFILNRYGRGDGLTDQTDLLETVRGAIEEVASITDDVDVRWANIIPYRLNIKLEFSTGTDKPACLAKVVAAVDALAKRNHRLGKNIVRDEILAELYQAGVEQALLVEPANDIAVPLDSVGYNAGIASEEGDFIIEEANALLIEGQTNIQLTLRTPQFFQTQVDMAVKTDE